MNGPSQLYFLYSGKYLPAPWRSQMRCQKMAFGRQDDVFLEWELFLNAKIDLGSGDFYCSLFSFCFLPNPLPLTDFLTFYFNLREAPLYKPGEVCCGKYIPQWAGKNSLGLETEYGKNYLPIQKKLVPHTSPLGLRWGKLAQSYFFHFYYFLYLFIGGTPLTRGWTCTPCSESIKS